MVVPLNETSESGVVEQVEVQSSEPLETEVVQEEEVPVDQEQVISDSEINFVKHVEKTVKKYLKILKNVLK